MAAWTVLLCCCLALLALRLVIGLLAGALRSRRGPKLRTMIVLGSGGHTAEMMALLQGLDPARYSPRCYVVAQTDRMSGMKADAFEAALAAAAAAAPGQQSGSEKEAGEPGAQPQQRQQEGKEPPAGEGGGVRTRRQAAARHTLPERPPAGLPEKQRQQQPYSVVHIPRSREVGQSFVTSVWTTLWALGHSVGVVLRFRPDVVLVNGPGTCIPICLAAVLARLVGLAAGRIMYIESIARVYRLSLTGKILYHSRLADGLLVQWPDLLARYPRCRYAGRVM